MADVLVSLSQVHPPVSPPRLIRMELMGQDKLTGGGARWKTTDRARRRSVITWEGTDLHRRILPLQIDGMEISAGQDRSIEDDCLLLWAWGQPLQTLGTPPWLHVTGPLLPLGYTPWWVLDELEWGDCIRRADGQRIQQDVTVTLLEHLAPSLTVGPAAAARARAGL